MTLHERFAPDDVVEEEHEPAVVERIEIMGEVVYQRPVPSPEEIARELFGEWVNGPLPTPMRMSEDTARNLIVRITAAIRRERER